MCKAELKQLLINCRIAIITKVFTEKREKKLRKIDSDPTKKDMMADEVQNSTELNQNMNGSNSEEMVEVAVEGCKATTLNVTKEEKTI